jgi:hypothetical protein
LIFFNFPPDFFTLSSSSKNFFEIFLYTPIIVVFFPKVPPQELFFGKWILLSQFG